MPQPPILRDRKLINVPPDLIITGQSPDINYGAHRIILMCISPYFQKVFQYSRNQNKTTVTDEFGNDRSVDYIQLDISEKETLSTILQYAYSGRVDLNVDFIQDLIIAADKYNIYGLIKESTRFLETRLNPDNCIGIHLFASFYNCFELEKIARNYILGNFETIYQQSEEFLDLTTTTSLIEIFKTHFLYVSDELIVWHSLIKWIEYDAPQRIGHFEELACLIRFGLIDDNALFNHVLNHPYVINNNRIQSIIQEVLETRKMLESCDKPTSVIYLNDTVKHQLAPRYPKDIIFVFGGRSLDVEFVSPEPIVEAYDHRAERWRQVNLEDPSGPRDHHQICVVGKYLFILGGHHGPFNVFNSCRKLDLTTWTWSEIAPMREKRAFHASAIIDNQIYVIGGYNGARRTDSVERYDIEQNQWTSCSSMNERRSGAGAAVLNGKIYVVGGFRDSNYLNTGEVYDPISNQWMSISSMSRPRSSPAVVAFNGKLHVIGGLTSNGLLSSCEKYDPNQNKWDKMENEMLEKKCSAAAVVLEDKILVIGGWNGVGGLRTVELWCDKAKRWLLGTKLIKRRTGCAACVVTDVQNIENFAWLARENIAQERILNALRLNSENNVDGSSFDNDELLDEFDQLSNRQAYSRAAPNNFDDIMDIDPN